MNSDWNSMRIGLMQHRKSLWWTSMHKWVWHFCQKTKKTLILWKVAPRKIRLGLKLFMAHHGSFIYHTTSQPLFHQVIHRQCPHCLFIFVYASTSNPALSSFSPPTGSMSAVRFDVEPQFIRLSLWTPNPPWLCNMNQSIIICPTYLPRLPTCFSYSPPGLD